MATSETVTPTAPVVRSPAPTAAPVEFQTPFAPVPIGAKTSGIAIIDYLAATAMQGLVTHGMKVQSDRVMTDRQKDEEIAQRAYQIAAAMLNARTAALKELSQ